MNPQSALYSALLVLAALIAPAPGAIAAPEVGRYVGVVRITKTLPPYYKDALSVSTTHKVVAEVAKSDAGLTLTFLTEVGEPPRSAFQPGNSVIVATLKSDGSCVVKGPPFGTPDGPTDYQATLKETRIGFTLRHDNIPMGVNFLVDPHLTGPTTDFLYVLYKIEPRRSVRPAATTQ